MAIIAVIVATAGWTTVAVMVVNGKPAEIAAAPSASDEFIDEESFPPDEQTPESHAFPDLEALLPTEAGGAQLAAQSFTGTEFLPDDGSAASVLAYLASIGKTPADLQAAVTGDPSQNIDLDTVWVHRLAGVDPEGLRDAMIEGVRANYPEMTMATVTIGDKTVVQASLDGAFSIWYINDGLLFDVESFDEALAASVLAGLPPASAPAGSPAASPAAPASPAP